MQLLKTLSEYSKNENLSFLLIGGHAVNALGYARQTSDLDMLIKRSDREAFTEKILSLDYVKFQDHEVFLRFKPDTLDNWPIDLMLVEDSVFQSLHDGAKEVEFSGADVLVPSPKHMIALKLHALKEKQEHREARDILDVIELLRLHTLDDDELRLMCEKYGRIDLYERLKK